MDLSLEDVRRILKDVRPELQKRLGMCEQSSQYMIRFKTYKLINEPMKNAWKVQQHKGCHSWTTCRANLEVNN